MALVKKMLLLLEPDCATNRIDFKPANDQARGAIRANAWRERRRRHHLVTLVQTIATKVCEENGFVIVHFDGDCAWSERGTSDIREIFDKEVRERVVQVLGMEKQDRVDRLRVVQPFWAIEAWLYQNTDEAIRICEQRCGGRHVERFRAWKVGRAELDELREPKRNVCLGSSHNQTLAETAYPAGEVYEARASFAAAVDELLECEALCQALQRTWDGSYS